MSTMKQPVLDGIDPEAVERMVSRRDALRQGGALGGKAMAALALGSVPVALAALARETFAQTPADILDALRFAYVLENLENEFYRAVLGTSLLPAQNAAFAPVRAQLPAAAREALAQIQKHEQQHVDFLRAAIPSFGGVAPLYTAADFDFTGGNGSGTGPFARATTELDFLLLAAQAFEDTGVRAYKGQAGRFLVPGSNAADSALESALRIHSVEARHASKIRRLRRQRNPSDETLRYAGYVVGGGAQAAGLSGVTNLPAEVTAALGLIYGGGGGGTPAGVSRPESNTQHVVVNASGTVTIDVGTLGNLDDIPSGDRGRALTMAFDEALTKEEVIAIVAPFIRDDAGRGLP